MRVWAIALFSLLIQGVFSIIGFIAGLVVVGLVLGYRRAWDVAGPRQELRIVEDEDD